ncbi:extracellular solute-binding protein [Paenibacillus sp.]|uniref:extracellular solute-binding protein n=1 Tax=Paenibacillus sp. TaxID=58172 RepID=UPI002D49248F|nr:extracellular solute-binding protein [Paenibacillus sp.]HZG58369.1 extracellular solute-binding protein [Paenibacillus sp.]
MKRTKLGGRLNASIVIASLLFVTACGGGTASPTDGGTAAEGTASAGKTSEPTAPEKPSEPVAISVFVMGAAGLPTPDKDPILQKLNEELHMEMEFNAPATDYEQQLGVKIAGGTPPDLFIVNKESMEKYASQGVLLEIGKYLDRMPNVKAKWPESELNKGKVGGKVYALPKRPLIPVNNTYFIRQDWLNALGLSVPTTVDELFDVANAFTYSDPDGNGKQDTFGITGIGLEGTSPFLPIFSAYNTPGRGHIVIKDNAPAYSTAQPEFKAALTAIKAFVEAKVVDPEFMANQGTKADEKAYKGLAGINFAHWARMTKPSNVEVYKAVNPKAEWTQMDALTGPGGKYQGVVDQGSAPGFVALPSSLENQPEKLNKVLEYIDYVSGGEGELLVNYGLEGVHYEMKDGKVSVLPASTDVAYSHIHQITNRDDYQYLQVKFPDLEQYYNFSMNQPYIKVYTSFVTVPPEVNTADLKRYEEAEIIKFIYGQRPLDEFDAFVQTLRDTYKIDALVAEADKKLKDVGIIQ